MYNTPLLDPDAIGKALQPTIPGTSAVAAARHVLIAAHEHIHKRDSFAVETTLSGQGYLRMMLDARARGFEIVLVYIGTENVELNLARIRDRVLAGGHHVPEVDVLGGAIQEVSRISQPPSNERTTPSCSITQPTRATVWWRFSARLEISGSSLFPSGTRQQITTVEEPIEPGVPFSRRVPHPFALFCERVRTMLPGITIFVR